MTQVNRQGQIKTFIFTLPANTFAETPQQEDGHMSTVSSKHNACPEKWSGYLSLPILSMYIFLPLLIGGFVYILFRQKSLLMFRWFRFFGMDDLILAWRIQAAPYRQFVPEFVLTSLPDGIWVYSLTVLMGSLWHRARFSTKLFWVSAGPLLGIGGELGQALGFVPGTFDYNDLIVSLTATLAALIITTRKEALN